MCQSFAQNQMAEKPGFPGEHYIGPSNKLWQGRQGLWPMGYPAGTSKGRRLWILAPVLWIFTDVIWTVQHPWKLKHLACNTKHPTSSHDLINAKFFVCFFVVYFILFSGGLQCAFYTSVSAVGAPVTGSMVPCRDYEHAPITSNNTKAYISKYLFN